MILCLTGLSCSGKTTASKLFSEKYGYKTLSVREISHSLAVEKGYARTREWLDAVSIQAYLSECREKVIDLLHAQTKDIVIDDMFDLQLWNHIHTSADSVLLSFDAPYEIRCDRMARRENGSDAGGELDFLDNWKLRLGIQEVIGCSIAEIAAGSMTPDEICEKMYHFTRKYSLDHIFMDDLRQYKETIDHMFEPGNPLFGEISGLSFMEKYRKDFFEYSRGGKRIRAYLVKLGYELTKKEMVPGIAEASVSYEVFQTGILVHDDVIDESDTRRNLPTMHVKLGGDHIAMSKAICVGDLGIIQSLNIISALPFQDSLIKKAILHQTKIFEITVSGELKDIELSESEAYSLDDVIEMYRLKTAWYTMIGPMQLGAILGNAGDALLKQIEELGSFLGIAFQIRDDILGIFGQGDVIGKSNLSDMQEGKKTVLTEYFSSHASAEMAGRFQSIYGRSGSGEEEIVVVRQLLRESGALEFSENLCGEYLGKAKNLILSMDTTPYIQQVLLSFLYYLNSRNY